jgi:hypothetical protein
LLYGIKSALAILKIVFQPASNYVLLCLDWGHEKLWKKNKEIKNEKGIAQGR